ncbi:hypothetical protein F4810DRAFT_515470 [Camillea tinctor]|nr:hypothetical protein F4810DRAFT_515470 [Camillea tinctor]
MLDAFEDDDSEGDDVSSCGEEPFDPVMFRASEAEQDEFKDLFSTHLSSSTIAVHKGDASYGEPSESCNSKKAGCSSSPGVFRPRPSFGSSCARYTTKETDGRNLGHMSIISCSPSIWAKMEEDVGDKYADGDRSSEDIIGEEYDALDDFVQGSDNCSVLSFESDEHIDNHGVTTASSKVRSGSLFRVPSLDKVVKGLCPASTHAHPLFTVKYGNVLD